MTIGYMVRTGAVCLLACGVVASGSTADPDKDIALTPLGTYASGDFNGTEIAAYDAQTQRLFTTNVADRTIDIVSISNPSAPALVKAINIAPYGAWANGVAVRNGIVAVAVEAVPKTSNGTVVFFNPNGDFISSVTVGAQPDMLT